MVFDRETQGREKVTRKRKITITVDENIFAVFKQFCKNNAMKVSSKVELLMRESIEKTLTQQAETQKPNEQQKENATNNTEKQSSNEKSTKHDKGANR